MCMNAPHFPYFADRLIASCRLTTLAFFFQMRCLIFVLLGLVAVYAAPVAEDNDVAAFMAEMDAESHLSPMSDEEDHVAKRTISDEDLERRKYPTF